MVLRKLFESGPEAYISKLVDDANDIERLL
jgi:hypothetical protein